jgi:hypothetical protein
LIPSASVRERSEAFLVACLENHALTALGGEQHGPFLFGKDHHMRQRIVWGALLWLGACLTAQAGSSAHPIYRCETATGLVFSDRPCSAEAQPYEPDLSAVSVVETVAPNPTPVAKSPRPAKARIASGSSTTSKADACRKLNDSLHKIASTMRSGYGAKEGERLKERKRELEAKRRAQKC